MSQGPELGADPPPRPEPPPPSDAARIIDAITDARQTIVRTIVVATLLILMAIAYAYCRDPHSECRALVEKERGPEGLSDEDLATWDELRCGRFAASPLSR
ncbi:MAG TPA: hypothetical protein VEV43_12645 [Actinomycetota bacterium]|nr:hypothetical protein [Actinomycetota bacterium]